MDIKWIQIYQMVSTLLVLLWKLGESVYQENKQHSASACFYQQDKTLTLNCSQGYMVKLNHIFYGASGEPNICGYEAGHCTMDLPNTELYPCIGRTQCEINLPSGDLGKIIPKCQQESTYAQANYECIEDKKVIDICADSDESKPSTNIIKGQSGYIRTPRYPNNYPDSQDCTVKIVTLYPSQRIKLYIIDLLLERNETDCADTLHTFDGHRAATYCGTRTRMEPISSMDNTFELTFHSDNQNKQKGFWLYFEATPYINPTTTSLPETTTVMNVNTKKTTPLVTSGAQNIHQGGDKLNGSPTSSMRDAATATVLQATSSRSPDTIYEGTALTIGAVMGVLVSLLLVITVIILVILLCYKRKDHLSNVKVPSSSSCNSEAAFLHLSNNCYPQNNLNNPPSQTNNLPQLSSSDYVCMNNSVYLKMGCDNGVGSNSENKIINDYDALDYCNNSKSYPIEDIF